MSTNVDATGVKTCKNCLHLFCMFHGEDREPVYRHQINCWDNAQECLGHNTTVSHATDGDRSAA